MRIEWSNEAEVAFDAVFERLQGYSDRAAMDFVRRVTARIEVLADHPRIGRIVPEYGIERFRELIEPPYRIMYQVFADRVEIATIRHSAEHLRRADD